MKNVVHRKKNDVERLLAVFFLDQVVDVRDSDLRREAGVNCAAARAGSIQLGACVIRINDIFRLHAQAFEICIEERGICVDVQHARDPDAQLTPVLQQ